MQLSLEQLNVFLNTAVRENQIENAKYYLEKGAGLILEGQKNPLDFAAFTGNVPMIELLLDHGVSHVTRNKDGKAPIQMVADQDWASYNAFGLRRADIDPATGISGNFCVGLISAIQHDNLEVAEAFLKAGVATDGTYRIDSKTTTSYQLAHLAAHKGNKEMIRLLLEYGASFETVEKKNGALKPAQILVKKGYWDCVNLLTEKLTEQVPDQYCFGHALILAVDQNKIEEAKCLLKAKARTGWHFTNNNNRPLHIAALAGNSLLIGWLLHHDAKNTDKNKEGKTPIELVRKDDWESYLTFGLYNRDYEAAARYHVGLLNAVRHNQLKVARVLLTANADTRVEFTKGQAKYNLVHVAAKKGNLGMIALLLEYNVDFSAIATKKNVPCKPLKILEKKQHWHCVKWIADHQKEINKDEFSYGSALIEVVKKGWVDVAESRRFN
jgi:ankyrin repeat protein